MTSPHIAKLQSLTRCPCCGADASEMEVDPRERYARTAFVCSAEFAISQGIIISSIICPAGSRLAAKLMNIEAEGKVGTEQAR